MDFTAASQSAPACEPCLARPSERALTIAERARQLEIASYLLAASVPLNEKSSASPAPAALSRDPNLPALVQLGALRLDCDRAFVSLIDGAHQYIVAEATRSTSVTELGRWAPGDAIYLGVQTLDISFGVCPNTMEVFTDTTGNTIIRAPNVTADRTRYIIRDFQAEPHYSERPYVKGWPYMRSYAEVPLVSPLGYIIGSYCVVDNKVRDFDDETVFVLNEVAQTIMAHLDLVKSKQTHTRSQSLMKGLAFFMEGDSSISNQDKDTLVPILQKDRAVDNAHSEERITRGNSISSFNTGPSPSHTESFRNEPSSASSIPSQNIIQTPLTTPLDLSDADPFSVTSLPPRSEGHFPSKYSDILHAETLGASVEESVISSNVRAVFYRAAALIRQTINMDGVIFLDACSSGFDSRKDQSTFPTYDDNNLGREGQHSTQQQSSCDRLASSIQSGSGAGTATLTKDYLNMPEALLQRLIRRYPRGRIFSADEFGPIDEGYSPSPEQGKALARRNADVKSLFQFVPQARSIIFLPLWHYQKELWFAGTLGWTTDPINAFTASDITYLAAFGNALMAEVSRFEAMDLSYAKSDFISSLSHELRSPLHGILASAELLRHSTDKADQSTLLDMIESCGSTLLDTMNHLLDYAKINKLARPSVDQTGNILLTNPQQGQSTVESTTDLAALVQDVVEGVYIGHKSRDVRGKFSIEDEVSVTSPTTPPVAVQEEPVCVTVYIQKQPSWQLKVTTGAWKRIIMNLFGNSLKYTPSGQIEVGLQIVRLADTVGVEHDHVCFSVKDTGIGMSAEYMRYRIFTPFSQENGLSVGTGLGLSIVHQIVKSMGGKLEVQSETGVGTYLKVFIPLDTHQVSENVSSLDPESKLKGLTLCLVNPSLHRKSQTSVGDELEGSDRTSTFQECVAQIASEWLQMNVIFADDWATEADIFVVDGASPQNSRVKYPPVPPPQLSTIALQAPTVVIGERNAGDDSMAIGGGNVFTLHHPIGPKKLASALLNALARIVPQALTNGHSGLDVVQSESVKRTTDLNLNGVTQVSVSQEAVSISTLHIADDSSPIRKPHVMVVDDNIVNSKILTTYVKRLGCSYIVASDGLQAVNAYKASPKPFDFVFMDLSMPVMNGFVATREIRAHEQAAQLAPTQVVALTGLGSAVSQKEALASGVNIYLIKPVSLKEIKKLLVGGEKA